MGSWGLLTTSLAASQGQQVRGQAGLLRYEYQATGGGVGVTHRADSAGYASLSDTPVQGNRLRETQVYANRVVGEGQSVWISHSRRTTRPGPQVVPEGWRYAPLATANSTSIGFAAYVKPWGGSLRLTASRADEGRGPVHALTASLVFLLDGGGLLATQLRRDPEGHTGSVQWSRPAPNLGGWGWDIGASHAQGPADTLTAWRASAQLESHAIRLRGDLSGETGTDRHALRVAAAGALTFVDGRAYRSRPVEDSFAVVKVGELAGVPVSVNGQPAGVTDARGHLFIPRVSAHQDTTIALDGQALPLDQTVPELQRRVALPERSGAVIRFETRRLRALATQLMLGGQPLAQAHVWIGSGTQAIETFTGPQGELYLENLAPGAHLGVADAGGRPCRFDLVVPPHEQALLELGPLTCTPDADDQKRSPGPR